MFIYLYLAACALGYVQVLYRSYRRSLEDNVKTKLKEIEMEGVDWIQLVQDRDKWRALVNTPMKLRVPKNARNFLSNS
jgi:hypothetical protein